MDTKIGAVDAPSKSDGNGIVGFAPPLPATRPTHATLGCHLARRLVQIGITDVFLVLDDFNLTLPDLLIAEPTSSSSAAATRSTLAMPPTTMPNSAASVPAPSPSPSAGSASSTPSPAITTRTFPSSASSADTHELTNTAISTMLKESKPIYISIICNIQILLMPTTLKPKEDKLWGGQHHAGVTDAVVQFNESISFDKAIYRHVIAGHRAHAAKFAHHRQHAAQPWRDREEDRGKVFALRVDREDVHINIKGSSYRLDRGSDEEVAHCEEPKRSSRD